MEFYLSEISKWEVETDSKMSFHWKYRENNPYLGSSWF